MSISRLMRQHSANPTLQQEEEPKLVMQIQLTLVCLGWAGVCRQKVGAMHSNDTLNPLENETQVKDGLRRLFRSYGKCREDIIENVFLCDDSNVQQSGTVPSQVSA